jgi:hypothetical protein
MKSDWELITVPDAREALRTADCGRSISNATIERYARDMASGNWARTPEPVIVSEHGGTATWRDGQQRGWAVIRAGRIRFEEGKIPDPDDFGVEFYVTRGEKDEIDKAFPFFNTGKNRTGGDTFGMMGHENPTMLYTVARRVALWTAGRPMGNAYKPTRAEVIEVVVKYPDLIKATEFAVGWKVRPPVPAAGTVGFLWWLLGTANQDDRDTFLEYLRTADGLNDEVPGEPHPLKRLRARLHADAYDAMKSGHTIRQEAVTWLALRAWMSWHKDSGSRRLQMPKKLSDESFERFAKEFRRAR